MWTRDIDAGPDLRARVITTGVSEGDLAVGGEPAPLAIRRRQLVDRPWLWLDQVHGAEVVVLSDSESVVAVAGASADAAVTRRDDVVLVAHSADCATIALVSADGVIGVVHAGWRGLVAGVVGDAVGSMRQLGATDVVAVLGPCIGVECYEFGVGDLSRVVDVLGPGVSGSTRSGRAALDLRAGVRSALAGAGVRVVASDDRCTACGRTAATDEPVATPDLFSHRARADGGRQALLVWLEPGVPHP